MVVATKPIGTTSIILIDECIALRGSTLCPFPKRLMHM